MALKTIAICVAVLSISVMYLHEHHLDKIMFINNIPIVKESLSGIHNFIVKYSSKLSFFSPNSKSHQETERLFTEEELATFNGGEGSSGIYISVLGKVFDVSKGSKHYGPGGSYHAFAGKDASRAFVTGDFSETGATDDVMGLSPDDLKSIQDWSHFYHNEYTFKGKLVGRYYTSNGDRTDYHEQVDGLIKKALDDNAAQNADYQKYPPCNVEWTPETGSKVWCSNRSGGIEREWAGVPRKYYKPGSDTYRCACIKLTDEVKQSSNNQRKGNLMEYEGCLSVSDSCYVKD